ncbi:PspA/IM30 family protein [Paradesulfitobacterium ferrireducens]|uniref:PspA/IM30 family protein n=1 Tax=Paradesulfitobacterium ferrireducens TaxID=2816476 RepID=UPI001A8DC717|nr:hypothetical protein [Paradesulfitobacterium ferrireducens]
MCGGRGWGSMFGFGCGGGLFDPYPGRDREYYEPRTRNQEYGNLRAEIRNLYASGEITQNQYYDALDRLDRGSFTRFDLEEMRRRGQAVGRPYRADNGPAGRIPYDIRREIESLEGKQKEIVKAKEETNKVIADINNSLSALTQQMALVQELAKQTVDADETRARSYLKQRQELAEQAAALEVRLKELKEDLDKLEQAETTLKAKLLELKAVGQRERLTALLSD